MLTLLLVLAATMFTPAAAPELTVPEVVITIHPSTMDEYQLLKRRTPYTYSCEAMVYQAEPGKLYGKASLTVLPGETEKVTTHNGDYTLDFSVSIKKGIAKSVVAVKRGEQLITRQRSTVTINAKDAGNVPLR